jgi:hypothetical protein
MKKIPFLYGAAKVRFDPHLMQNSSFFASFWGKNGSFCIKIDRFSGIPDRLQIKK